MNHLANIADVIRLTASVAFIQTLTCGCRQAPVGQASCCGC